MSDFNKKADVAFVAGITGYFLQLALILLTTTVLLPTHKSPNITAGIFICLPLLILLPWLLKRNIRAFLWLCFVELGYFIPATQHLFMLEQYGGIAYIEAVVVVWVFVVAMLFGRWEQKRYGISVTR